MNKYRVKDLSLFSLNLFKLSLSHLTNANPNYLLVETDSAKWLLMNRLYLLKPDGAFKSKQIQSSWNERRSTSPQSHRSAGRDGGVRQNDSDRLISWK